MAWPSTQETEQENGEFKPRLCYMEPRSPAPASQVFQLQVLTTVLAFMGAVD